MDDNIRHENWLILFVKALSNFFQIADETAKKCESKVNQQCVSLQQIRSMFSLKSLLNVIFGDSVTDEETVLAFKKAYDVVC